MKLRKTGVLLAATALVLTGCGRGGGGGEGDGDISAPGVTSEPCPEAVNKDNGCIYLGQISDLTQGPFAPLGVPITDSMKAFWQRVNEDGGIGGYDIDVTKYVRDNLYNPETHREVYNEIEGDVLALAQTLGSPTTFAILENLKSDEVLAAPASWTSLWEFEDNIIESGAPYCMESMNVVDYAIKEFGAKSVTSIGFPGDYGGDSAAGVKIAAEANKLEYKNVETAPGQEAQAGAISAVVKEEARPGRARRGTDRDRRDRRPGGGPGLQGQVHRHRPHVEPGPAEEPGRPGARGAVHPLGSLGELQRGHAGPRGHA